MLPAAPIAAVGCLVCGVCGGVCGAVVVGDGGVDGCFVVVFVVCGVDGELVGACG